jgi:hypothetical protein
LADGICMLVGSLVDRRRVGAAAMFGDVSPRLEAAQTDDISVTICSAGIRSRSSCENARSSSFRSSSGPM